MSNFFQRSELSDIARRVETGDRLSGKDGIRLLKSNDLLCLGSMADYVRRKKHGDKAYFILNRHINHTNVCVNRCLFCAFGRDEGDCGSYTLTLDEIEQKAMEYQGRGITEIHIVGGLNEKLALSYYDEMLRRVRRALPGVKIQSFTAVEIDYLARVNSISVESVLRELKAAGLERSSGFNR